MPRATTIKVMLQVRFRQRNACGTPSTMQPSASPCDSPKVVSERVVQLCFQPSRLRYCCVCCLLNLYKSRNIHGPPAAALCEHKHTIAAVIKLQPGERNIRYCSIRCTMLLPTSQINTPSQQGNLPRFQECDASVSGRRCRCQAQFRLVAVFIWQVGHISASTYGGLVTIRSYCTFGKSGTDRNESE